MPPILPAAAHPPAPGTPASPVAPVRHARDGGTVEDGGHAGSLVASTV